MHGGLGTHHIGGDGLMPPRQSQPQQLDEISESIGHLRGTLTSVEKYIHENSHGVNNLSQKVEALGVRITRDIAAVEGRIEGRIKAMDDRLAALEAINQRQAGAKSFAIAFLHSPVIAWIFAIAVAAWTYFKGPAR